MEIADSDLFSLFMKGNENMQYLPRLNSQHLKFPKDQNKYKKCITIIKSIYDSLPGTGDSLLRKTKILRETKPCFSFGYNADLVQIIWIKSYCVNNCP